MKQDMDLILVLFIVTGKKHEDLIKKTLTLLLASPQANLASDVNQWRSQPVPEQTS